MSASPTPQPPAARTEGARHERPRRASRRAAGPPAALLAALLAVLVPAGIWSQTSTISIEKVDSSRFEGQEAEFRVTSRADFISSRGVRNDDVTVTVAVTQTGAFLSGTPPTSVAVAPNGSTVLRVPTDNDDRTEDDGSVTVQMVARDAYSVHSTKGQATVAVKDNDRTVWLRRQHATRVEGAPVRFTVHRTGQGDRTVWVDVTQDGDFLSSDQPGRRTVRFGSSESEKSFSVTTVNDNLDEADGSVTATIVARAAEYEIGTPATVTTIVTDNDLPAVPLVHRDIPRGTDDDPTLHVVASDASKVEGEVVTFVVFANSTRTERLTIDVEVTQKGDFLLRPPFTSVTILADRDQVQISLATFDDDEAELDGALTVRLVARDGYTIDPDRAEATTIVTDNEPRDLPVVGIEVAPDTADEGTAFLITAIRDGATAESLTVRLSVADSGDFTELASSSLTFAEGEAETTLTLPTDDDDADEADGTLTVTLDADDAYRIDASAGTRSVTVRDDDLPVLTMAPAANVVDEGDTAEFVLTRSGDLSEPLTVTTGFVGRPVTFGLTPDQDRDVTFTAGSATATLSVAPVDDERHFLRRDLLGFLTLVRSRFRIALSEPASEHAHIYEGIIVNKVIVTDNDVGKVWVAASADSVPESGRACFTIRTDALVRGTDASVDMDVTVAVTQEGDYLAAGEDGQRTVTLDDGDSDAGLCLDLDDDEVSEVHGAVEVEVLSTSEGDGVVPDPERNKATVTVRDDDLPVVTMAPAANVVDEGDTAEFVLTRSGDLSEPLTAEASFVGRPSGHGLTPNQNRDVTFTAGSRTATLSVATVDDDRYFVDRQVLVALTEYSGHLVALPGPASAHVFIEEYSEGDILFNIVFVTDDDVGKVWVSATADSVPESGRACFTIRTDALVRAPNSSVEMDVTVAVTQEGDYLAAGEDGQRTVTLEDKQSARLCLDLDDDEVDEHDGAVIVEVRSTSEGAGVVPDPRRSTARVTVRDNEPTYLTLATAATSVDEGGSVTFTLTREGPVDEPLAVPGPLLRSYHSDQSFLAPHREHPVTFAPGSATETFTVTPDDDQLFSVLRYLYVELVTEFQGLRGGFRLRVPESTVLQQQSNVIITRYRLPVRDNDQVRVSITPRTAVVDEGEPACVTVASDAVFPAYWQSEIVVTVAVSQQGDYLATAPGNRTVTLSTSAPSPALCLELVDDDRDEDDGAVTVALVTAEGSRVVAGESASATVTVHDNDPPFVTLMTTATQVAEAAAVTFTLTREGPLTAPLTIPATLLRSTIHPVTPGHRPVSRGHEVTFGAGSDTATVTIAPGADDLHFEFRQLNVTLRTSNLGLFRLRVPDAPAAGSNNDATRTAYHLPVVEDDPIRIAVEPRHPYVYEQEDACFTFGNNVVWHDLRQDLETIAFTVSVSAQGDFFAAPPADRTVTMAEDEPTRTLCLQLDDDDEVEEEGSVTVAIVADADADPSIVAAADRAAATVRLLDNELPEVTLSAVADTVTEGEHARFKLALDAPVVLPFSAQYRLATAGDYGFEVSAADGVWLRIVSAGVDDSVLQVITRDDGVDEPDGSVTFTLLEGAEYTGEYTIAPDSPRSVTVTVADDDLPIISMAPRTDEESVKRYGEGDEVSFTFIRDGDLSVPLTIPAGHLKSRYSPDRTPGWTGVGPLVFEVGSAATTVTIATEDDDFHYGIRHFTLRLGFGGSGLFRTPDDGGLERIVIVRDDDFSRITLSVAAVEASVSEADQACFLLTTANLWFDPDWRPDDTGYGITAYVEQEGSFLAETNASGRGRELSDRLSAASERRCVDLDDDDRFEPDGSVTLSVLEFVRGAIPEAQRPRATVTVTDDDFVPTLVSVAAESSSIAEGDWARFSLTRTFGSHEGGLSVEVMVREQGGPYLDRSATLLLSQDYGDWWGPPLEVLDADGRGVVYLRATSDERVEVRVATADDLVAEAPGFITVELATPDAAAPYALGGSASATIEVRSDDGGEVSVEAVTPEVTEGEDAVFRFTRTGYEGRLRVDVAIRGHHKVMSDASRTLAENTGPAPDLTIVFEDGVTEVTQTLTTEADRYNEGDGEVVLLIERLRPDPGVLPYRVAGAASAAVLVRDDDIPEVELNWLSPEMTLVDDTSGSARSSRVRTSTWR